MISEGKNINGKCMEGVVVLIVLVNMVNWKQYTKYLLNETDCNPNLGDSDEWLLYDEVYTETAS